jgi:DNA-binding SARP family transcriptional activator/tetratricopeptide (TPR) repeat protein
MVSPVPADVRLLGSITVTGPAGPAGLIGGRQRSLVGMLALHAGAVVATSRLVDALWPDDPPRTAVRTLHSHAARVRKALVDCGLADALVTRGPGYLLAVPRGAVDAFRFEDGVRAARDELAAAAPDRAAAGLEAALALWQGDALADGSAGGWVATEVARLHGLRLAAAEELWELRLRAGRHVEAVAELDRLLGRYPTRERLVGLLMLALYRCGCPADALDRFERLRARLADELGADPGPALQRLHTAILRGEPALDLGYGESAATGGRPVPGQTAGTAAPSRPDGTGPPSTRPDGASSTPTRPDGTGSTPRRPDGTGSTSARPHGTGSTSARPHGASSTSARPHGTGPTPTRPDGTGPTSTQLAAVTAGPPEPAPPAADRPATSPTAPSPPAASSPVPAQLPPPVGHFAGRTDELRELDEWLAEPGSGPRIAVVRGAAGIGKTAFAVQWTRGVRDRFPDGQLYLDLRGHAADTALAASDALAQALRALGVPADRIPAELADQVGSYRSLVHDKRVLLLLDNAANADQVLPLVPTGDASLLVVTSRHDLAALPIYHAVRPIDLTVLSAPDATTLLDRVVGADRVRSEAAAAATLVELCGRLPLALRVAAAKLAARPRRRIEDLVGELAGQDRLDALSVEGDSRGLRAVFASAYGALTEPAARLFRLLGLQPGTSFTVPMAAAAAGVPAELARHATGELAAAHLIEDAGGGRYRFHDLIRLYAADRARAQEPDACRTAAVSRILDWYLAVADAVNRTLDPSRDRVVPAGRFEPDQLPFGPTPAAALSFLDGEHANLLSTVEYAAAEGQETVAWQLCYLLAGYFESRGHWGDRVAMYRRGLAAARRLDDPAVEGLMLSGLGVACIAARRHAEALEHLRPALELMRASGDRRGEGHAYNNIAAALGELRRFDEAIVACERALDVHTGNGHRLGMRLALNNLGCAHTRIGELDRGVAYLERGLQLARDDQDGRLEAALLHSLGEAHRRRRDHRAALDCFAGSLALRRGLGERRSEAEALTDIGLTHLDAGDPVAARDSAWQAHVLSREVGDEHLEAVAAAHLGRAYLATGDLAGAREWLLAALALRVRIPDRHEEAAIHGSIAELEERSGNGPVAAGHRQLAAQLRVPEVRVGPAAPVRPTAVLAPPRLATPSR